MPRGRRHGNTATPAHIRAQTIIGACDESQRVLPDEEQSRGPTKASEHSALQRLDNYDRPQKHHSGRFLRVAHVHVRPTWTQSACQTQLLQI